MNIVILTRKKACSGLLSLNARTLVIAAVSLFFIMPATFMLAGYKLGISYMQANPDDLSVAIQSELDSQRLALKEVTRTAEDNMDALALRLGNLQAHIIRLDALGERLTTMAKLDKGEFDFEQSPAQGGPISKNEAAGQMSVPDFMKSLEELSTQLNDRSQQLEVLEDMIMTRNLEAEVFPAGRPINRGWLSSYFGVRTDPFTGRRVHHSGVDFAGKMGSEVVAVAAGVVTFSGRKSGYGNLIEINHGKGYVTRYGHNSKNLVKVGDTIKKGQVVSEMGTTGRSTGPHVHFEVLYNGQAVNPKEYIHASR
ncbi:MAG: peptidoglycan DD-metalloendopeptidase family protein [Gammaproteobacteria bacterium]|nr:peptidoglycan DD-metalloendopeptidase family protein [Gammaproteobacteria bacterium]